MHHEFPTPRFYMFVCPLILPLMYDMKFHILQQTRSLAIQVLLEHYHRNHLPAQEDIKLMLIAEMLWLLLPYFNE